MHRMISLLLVLLGAIGLGGGPADAAGIDCPTARLRYSAELPIADLAAEPRALEALRRIAPQVVAPLGNTLDVTQATGFGRILSPAAVLKNAPGGAATIARLNTALAAIPVTRAASLKRCTTYDQVAPQLPATIRRPAILVFDKITGFRDVPSVEAARAALAGIAARHGWTIVTSDNGAVFNARDLRRFDAVVWNNVSGDALTLPQRAAFRRWIEQGGGYAGFHGSAGDPTSIWPWYVDTLVGARFIGHPGRPQFQGARVHVAGDDPITRGLSDWTMTEEWYSFGTNPRATGAKVLLTLDEATYKPIGYQGESVAMGADHPLAWTRCVGRGRTFYSAIGHRPESYTEPNSLTVLERGIAWAMGKGAGGSGAACPRR